MDDLQTLLDERACLRLMTDYCLHLDNRQVEPFLDLFTPDATWIQVNEPPYPLAQIIRIGIKIHVLTRCVKGKYDVLVLVINILTLTGH